MSITTAVPGLFMDALLSTLLLGVEQTHEWLIQ